MRRSASFIRRSLLVLVVFFGLPTAASAAATVLELNFDGLYDLYDRYRIWPLLGRSDVEIVEGGGRNESAGLRVFYQGGATGSQRVVKIFPMAAALKKRATLEFAVLFCPGFDFANGGKLHGLGPERVVAGGKSTRNGGWSARVVFGKGGAVGSYVYHGGQKRESSGDTQWARDFFFTTGRWYSIEFTVALNDRMTANGYTTLAIDGVEILRHQGLYFWSEAEAGRWITNFVFSTFFGGNAPSAAPRTLDGEYARVCAVFDEFKVSGH